MFSPNQLQFSIHDPEVLEEREGSLVICFCPIQYWNDHECLPDYFLTGRMENIPLPTGYKWLYGMEEACWIVFNKTREEVKSDLEAAGFSENKGMQLFLDDCWR